MKVKYKCSDCGRTTIVEDNVQPICLSCCYAPFTKIISGTDSRNLQTGKEIAKGVGKAIG